MLRAIAILLGSILTAILAFQVAVNAASDMIYWETGENSTGRLLWCGVVSVGLLMGGTILLLHNTRYAAAAFVLSLPLIIVYEMEHNQNYLSISLDRSVAWWIGVGVVMVTTLALITNDDSPPEPIR